MATLFGHIGMMTTCHSKVHQAHFIKSNHQNGDLKERWPALKVVSDLNNTVLLVGAREVEMYKQPINNMQ